MAKIAKNQMNSLSVPLRVVFYKEGDSIVAHCLEFDLMGDGDSHDAAIETLCEAISLQIAETLRTGNSKNLFNPAPGEYFRMFAAGRSNERVGKAIGELKITIGNIDLSEATGREYEDCDQAEGELVLV